MWELDIHQEYRPAWEIGGATERGQAVQIEHGWEIQTEDGVWVRVEGNLEYVDTSGQRGPICVILLVGDSKCTVWADELVMSRRKHVEQAPARSVPLADVDLFNRCSAF